MKKGGGGPRSSEIGASPPGEGIGPQAQKPWWSWSRSRASAGFLGLVKRWRGGASRASGGEGGGGGRPRRRHRRPLLLAPVVVEFGYQKSPCLGGYDSVDPGAPLAKNALAGGATDAPSETNSHDHARRGPRLRALPLRRSLSGRGMGDGLLGLGWGLCGVLLARLLGRSVCKGVAANPRRNACDEGPLPGASLPFRDRTGTRAIGRLDPFAKRSASDR